MLYMFELTWNLIKDFILYVPGALMRYGSFILMPENPSGCITVEMDIVLHIKSWTISDHHNIYIVFCNKLQNIVSAII